MIADAFNVNRAGVQRRQYLVRLQYGPLVDFSALHARGMISAVKAVVETMATPAGTKVAIRMIWPAGRKRR